MNVKATKSALSICLPQSSGEKSSCAEGGSAAAPQENTPVLRSLAQFFPQEGFQTKPAKQGPDLTGGADRPLAFKQDGSVEYRRAAPNPDGFKRTDTLTLGNGKLTASRTTEGADGSKRTNGGSVDDKGITWERKQADKNGRGSGLSGGLGSDGLTVSGSRTPRKGMTGTGSVSIGPDGLRTSAGASWKLGEKVSFSFKADTSAIHKKQTESKAGYTTATATGDLAVKVGASATVMGAQYGGSFAESRKKAYELRLKDEDFAKIQAGQAPLANHYNPETMPVGSSVKQDNVTAKTLGEELGFRNLKLKSEVTQEKGRSILVEKTDAHTVRVTAGPTEAVEKKFKLGLGPLNMSLGNTQRMDAYTLKTAEFDQSTEEGRAAYKEFLLTHQVPTANGKGVSQVASVDTLKLDSKNQLEVSLGPVGGTLASNFARGEQAVTSYPDGSQMKRTRLDYKTAVPVSVEQHFRADGTEDHSKQKLRLDIPQADPVVASYIQQAFTQDAQGARQLMQEGKKDLSLTFTSEQATQFQAHVQEFLKARGPDWHPITMTDRLLEDIAKAKSPDAAVLAIGRGWLGDGGLAETFLKLATSQGGPLPGTLTLGE